ncbi:UbiA prenyltransferase family protein [Candidatus Microgenomates bacterium]|nr:UbiA prenyltransferase family protein [Candidatus Microgenomates bacterium]
MANQTIALIRAARVTHWVKNLALFAALVFSGRLFIQEEFLITLWAVFIFSLTSSSIYFFNDVVDLEADKLHPVKHKRPIAQGLISSPNALFISCLLAITSLFLASFISFFFFLAIGAYLTLQVIYTLFLKKIAVVDILAIAAGFFLRIWAGAFVINIHMSVWFLLCVISVSLFLAAGKRRAELTILAQFNKAKKMIYPKAPLDSYLTMFGTAAWMSWALFTFFAPSPTIIEEPLPTLRTELLPVTIASIEKWLMITIPVVIFGIMRYLYITYTTDLAGSPERTLVRDKPLLVSTLLWGFLVVVILYFLPS